MSFFFYYRVWPAAGRGRLVKRQPEPIKINLKELAAKQEELQRIISRVEKLAKSVFSKKTVVRELKKIEKYRELVKPIPQETEKTAPDLPKLILAIERATITLKRLQQQLGGVIIILALDE